LACRAFGRPAPLHLRRQEIIITTVQKFPFILEDIGTQHKDRRFSIIIDEAHSSQGGKAAAALNAALSGVDDDDEDETVEDRINAIMEQRKMLPNASYFAFTATPKTRPWRYSANLIRKVTRSSIARFTATQ